MSVGCTDTSPPPSAATRKNLLLVPGAAAAAAAASRDGSATSPPNRPGQQTASALGGHPPSVSAATQNGSSDGPTGRSGSRALVAMKSLDLARCTKDDSSSSSGGGAGATQHVELQHQQQQSRPFSLSSPRTPHPGQHLAEQKDRDATRCELERLLTTAGTDDKKKKVILALDHLEESCRGTALAAVVNEAVATASATVAGAGKRRDSFTSSHEHARAGTDMLRRLSRDNCEPWITSDRSSGLVKPTAPPDPAEAYPARPGGIAGSLAGGRNNEAWSAVSRPDSARRFTVPLLASIPENRVPGRRLVVKEVSGESEGAKGCGGEKLDRTPGGSNLADSGALDEEPTGARALPGLGSLIILPCRGEVANVPLALLGDATSTGVDPLHPPWAAVDGALASFWLSTGLFPQTLTIRLQRPVVVYEVVVACGGVNAVGVQLGNSNAGGAGSTSAGAAGSTSSSSSRSGDRGGVGGRSGDRETKLLPYRRLEYSLELVGEERRRPSAAGNVYGAESGSETTSSFANMVFRVPQGERLEEADRLSLVVTSGLEPFCLVKSVAIRGQFGVVASEEEDEERSTDSE